MQASEEHQILAVQGAMQDTLSDNHMADKDAALLLMTAFATELCMVRMELNSSAIFAPDMVMLQFISS